MNQDISGVTLLKVCRLGIQTDLKQNQNKLLKLVFKPPNEKDLILQNTYKLKESRDFVRKNLTHADCIKRREAKNRTKIKVRCWSEEPSDCELSGGKVLTGNYAKATLGA